MWIQQRARAAGPSVTASVPLPESKCSLGLSPWATSYVTRLVACNWRGGTFARGPPLTARSLESQLGSSAWEISLQGQVLVLENCYLENLH
jgi:hypothetical protein